MMHGSERGWLAALAMLVASCGMEPDRRVFINHLAEVAEAERPIRPLCSEIRHPRTAMGLSQDGTRMTWLVVDGRQPEYSEGVSERPWRATIGTIELVLANHQALPVIWILMSQHDLAILNCCA
jgi:hypothetical protein